MLIFLTGLRSTAARQNPRLLRRGASQIILACHSREACPRPDRGAGIQSWYYMDFCNSQTHYLELSLPRNPPNPPLKKGDFRLFSPFGKGGFSSSPFFKGGDFSVCKFLIFYRLNGSGHEQFKFECEILRKAVRWVSEDQKTPNR